MLKFAYGKDGALFELADQDSVLDEESASIAEAFHKELNSIAIQLFLASLSRAFIRRGDVELLDGVTFVEAEAGVRAMCLDGFKRLAEVMDDQFKDAEEFYEENVHRYRQDLWKIMKNLSFTQKKLILSLSGGEPVLPPFGNTASVTVLKEYRLIHYPNRRRGKAKIVLTTEGRFVRDLIRTSLDDLARLHQVGA